MTDLREVMARAMQAAKRDQILKRIERGECSASMSGIDYFPLWEDAEPLLRKPFLAEADAALAAIKAAGCVVVPVEPTEVMKQAGRYAIGAEPDSPADTIEAAEVCYLAMMEAHNTETRSKP